MGNLFKGKYRTDSMRLKGHDYGQNASYFITICTNGREEFFGKIYGENFVSTEAGEILLNCWHGILKQFSFAILDECVVMPNHFHGLITICKTIGELQDERELNGAMEPAPNEETRLIASLHQTHADHRNPIGGVTGTHNPMLHKNLPRIIRWFKGRATFEIRKNLPNFAWQSGYHETIIRNHQHFINVQNYITNNPINWEYDKIHQI